jgi:predicted enzyme related to lactoylglutathione lyase
MRRGREGITMVEITRHPPGAFCWVDLATSDPDGAKAFYTSLFNWSARDLPTDRGVPYTMLFRGDRRVCALYRRAPDMGDRSRWQGYVAVADVDAAADSAAAMGARLLMAPMDVMQAGRLAVIQDPTGAAVGLWQAGEHAGAELLNEPGAQCWLELQTGDKRLAARFYGGLLGWTTRTSKSVMDGRYEIFVHDGREIGGMLQIEKEWGPVPPNWSVYFGVDDCDGALKAAVGLGAKALFPAMDVESVGRFAFLQDPQGAVFAVIELAHPV